MPLLYLPYVIMLFYIYQHKPLISESHYYYTLVNDRCNNITSSSCYITIVTPVITGVIIHNVGWRGGV